MADDGNDAKKPNPKTPLEFIRARPEESPEQGSAAGPDAPETIEPTQGERLPPGERSDA